jgi:hypothetical protein
MPVKRQTREEFFKDLEERIARGEFPKEPPSQEELPRFESHDDREIAKALEKLAEELDRTKTDPYAWKWVILALHNAIQATIVRAISGGDQAGALTDKSQKETRAWLRSQRDGKGAGEMPDQFLADFLELYKRAKKKPGVVVHIKLGEDVRRINDYRRQLAHYRPLIWTILVGGLPQRVLRSLDFVESLMPGRPTGGAQWLYPADGKLAERSLKLARHRATQLDARFNPPKRKSRRKG